MNIKLNLFAAALLVSVFTFGQGETASEKRGQAGATELQLNPWVRSAGWLGGSIAGVRGAEAMRLNVGGIAETKGMELAFANTNWNSGSGISSFALGYTQQVGDSSALGISLMSMNFGDFVQTSVDLPEGTGVTFKPQFFNLGIAYSKQFSPHVNGGILVRIVNESVANVSASGIAIDAGVQYKGGKKDAFKFGVSLRNVGSKLQFAGDGLTYRGTISGGSDYDLSLKARSEAFELPVMLNLAVSYDVISSPIAMFTLGGNFNSNSFTNDQLQFGAQYAFQNKFFARLGYNYYSGMFGTEEQKTDINNGLTAGIGVKALLSKGLQDDDDKKAKNSTIGIDYAFRGTNSFSGTHGISVTFQL